MRYFEGIGSPEFLRLVAAFGPAGPGLTRWQISAKLRPGSERVTCPPRPARRSWDIGWRLEMAANASTPNFGCFLRWCKQKRCWWRISCLGWCFGSLHSWFLILEFNIVTKCWSQVVRRPLHTCWVSIRNEVYSSAQEWSYKPSKENRAQLAELQREAKSLKIRKTGRHRSEEMLRASVLWKTENAKDAPLEEQGKVVNCI